MASTRPPASVVTSGGPAALVVDPSLLAILPARLGQIAVVASPDAAARMIGDKDLEASASGLAVGMAAGPVSSSGGDLVVATVIQLRPGVFSDEFFARWRTAYDEAACGPAGGVSGHARQTLGGRDVDVATCAAGARTYHVHLDGDILVSATAVGDHRFGERLTAGLRP